MVASGQFLVDSEARLRSVLGGMSPASGASAPVREMPMQRRGARHDRCPDPLVGGEPLSCAHRHGLPGRSGTLVGVAHAGRRATGPVRHPGHRAHQLSRQAAPGGRGPGHLPADDDHAQRARRQDGARLFLLRRLLRLRPLRRQDRPYWARSRVVEYLNQVQSKLPLAPRRRSVPTPPASAGSTSTRWWTAPARQTWAVARAERLVPEVRAEDGARRGRGRQRGRHGQAVPGRARPGSHARSGHHARHGCRGHGQGQPGLGRFRRRDGRDRVHGALSWLPEVARRLPNHPTEGRRHDAGTAARRRFRPGRPRDAAAWPNWTARARSRAASW